MIKTVAVVFAGLVLIQNPLSAAEFRSIARVGLDSNAFELSDGLSPTEEEFGVAGLYSKSSAFDWLHWDVKAEKSFYFNDSRGDHYQTYVELKAADDFTIYDVAFAYELGAFTGQNDETYVSRETGRVATFNGTSIADRFDNTEDGHLAGFHYLLREDTDIYIRYRENEIVYEDFALDGLDNLTAMETTSTFGVDFEPRDIGNFYFRFDAHERVYDDRRDRDLDGVLIADTDLIINRYETHLGYIYKPNERDLWEYRFTYENRTSNGTHFYEAQRGTLSIRGEKWIFDYHLLAFNLEYTSFFYDESYDQSFLFYEKDDIDQTKISLGLEYTWVLATLFDTNLAFYANVYASVSDSPNAFFVHQRNQASAGIRWAID